MSLTQDLRWSLGRSIALQLQRQTDLLLCTINCFLQWDHLPKMAVGDLAFYYTLYLCYIGTLWEWVDRGWAYLCIKRTRKTINNLKTSVLIILGLSNYLKERLFLVHFQIKRIMHCNGFAFFFFFFFFFFAFFCVCVCLFVCFCCCVFVCFVLFFVLFLFLFLFVCLFFPCVIDKIWALLFLSLKTEKLKKHWAFMQYSDLPWPGLLTRQLKPYRAVLYFLIGL